MPDGYHWRLVVSPGEFDEEVVYLTDERPLVTYGDGFFRVSTVEREFWIAKGDDIRIEIEHVSAPSIFDHLRAADPEQAKHHAHAMAQSDEEVEQALGKALLLLFDFYEQCETMILRERAQAAAQESSDGTE